MRFLILAAFFCLAAPTAARADDYSAWTWIKAEFGSAEAQMAAGLHACNTGHSENDAMVMDPDSFADAAKWFGKAAEQGYAPAQFIFASFQDKNTTRKEQDDAALQWLLKAAAQGYEPAVKGLGEFYQYQAVVPALGSATKQEAQKNFDESIKWFMKAAEKNNPYAEQWLGVIYEQGRGVPKDNAEAAKWYRKSAEQGFVRAEADLGRVLSIAAPGATPDYNEAYYWLALAAQSNPALAEKDKNEAAYHLKPEEIAAGDKRVAESQVPKFTPLPIPHCALAH